MSNENYGANLDVVFGSQKSFYGKAKVREIMGIKVLRSYDTDVAAITNDGEFHRLWGGQYIVKNYGILGCIEEWTEWTATTGKHIREFANQGGFLNFRKADYVKLAVEELADLIHAEANNRVSAAVSEIA